MTILWLLIGGAVGVLQVLTIWWTVRSLQPGVRHRILVWVIGGATLRSGLALGLLFSALRAGIVPGLLAFTGLWLGRWGMIRSLNQSHKAFNVFR